MGGERGRIRIGSPGWTIPMIRNLLFFFELASKGAQKTPSIVVYTYITYGLDKLTAFCFEEWNLSLETGDKPFQHKLLKPFSI